MSTQRALIQADPTRPVRSTRLPKRPADQRDEAVLLTVEAGVAWRWSASARRANDREPFPRDIVRAVLLQAGDHWQGGVWALAARMVVNETLRQWAAGGTAPARAFSWLVELEGYLQTEMAAKLDPELADSLRRICEPLLFDRFVARWREALRWTGASAPVEQTGACGPYSGHHPRVSIAALFGAAFTALLASGLARYANMIPSPLMGRKAPAFRPETLEPHCTRGVVG